MSRRQDTGKAEVAPGMGWLLWPGEKLCDWLGLTRPDDRQGFRIFANMVIWGLVIVAAAVVAGNWLY